MTEGTTPSERYLTRLCRQSFLRLWSWPNLFRDQRAKAGTEGKELCDLLAVFGRHVFIFSDKYCAFPDGGDLRTDWLRWFKRAVWKAADQVWGAERWIKEHPTRIFQDRSCSVALPYPLPSNAEAIFHRVVVAHGAAGRCRRELGGSGSLMLMNHIRGEEHFEPRDAVVPFAVGLLDPARGFVHVMDDVTLDVVLSTVDTVHDLASYFVAKEGLLTSSTLCNVAGEEELLATYLRNTDASGRHALVVPPGTTAMMFAQGCWAEFSHHRDRLAQLSADEVSYSWDALINDFTKNILGGTEHFRSNNTVADLEFALRLMASETRTERRMLSKALRGAAIRGREADRFARVLETRSSLTGNRTTYVFMTLKHPPSVPYEDYRIVRREMLMGYCLVYRSRNPSAKDIVGVAFSPVGEQPSGEDLVYVDGTLWDPDHQAHAERVQQDLNIYVDMRRHEYHESEYPRPPLNPQKGRHRNQVCPCGSGLKVKRCRHA